MKAQVVKLDRQPHPNADKLFLQDVGAGQVCCMNLLDWEGREYAVHIPPGALVDTDIPQFSWLRKGDERYHKVAARTIRGVESYGLMVEAPFDVKEGDDVTEHFKIG